MSTRQCALDVMTADTLTVDAGDGVRDLAQRLLDQGVSNAPVVERSAGAERLVGFVSEKDLMQCLARGDLHANPALAVRDIMRRHPLAVRPGTDVFTLASIFMREGFRHLPVIDGDHHLLGIVSRRDVLRALVKHYEGWSAPADKPLAA